MAYTATFDQNTVEAVWRKATIVYGYDPDEWRKDVAGAWIKKSEYGNTDSIYGWEIDHKYPVSMGGSDSILNLQPLQWENNRAKCDHYPYWMPVVTSESNRNIHRNTSIF